MFALSVFPLLFLCIMMGFLPACATEKSHVLEVPQVQAADQSYHGERPLVSIGSFDNRSPFMRGIFAAEGDPLGSQAKTILITHLQKSHHFRVLDRDNMAALKEERSLSKKQAALKGARYVITGDVTEFGRKNVGDQQLFGILGRGVSQVAYAKVNLNVVDPITSQVVYATQGAGEYSLSHREVVGFGGTASYDSTLNGKVLDLAIREAVNHLVQALENGEWDPAASQ